MKDHVEKLKIGVVGLSEKAGAAFVAVYLARMLGEIQGLRPALAELKKSRLYDVLAMGKHFADRDFFSFFTAVSKDESIRGRKNQLHGVNWALWTPSEEKSDVDIIRKIRLVNNISGNVVTSILPGPGEDEDLSCLKDMEVIVLVIDPLPSSLLAGHDLLCEIRALGIPAIYIVNKMNKGVAQRELLKYLKVKKLHYLPLIEGEHIYGAEYSSRQIYDLPHVRKILQESFRDIVDEILNFM